MAWRLLLLRRILEKKNVFRVQSQGTFTGVVTSDLIADSLINNVYYIQNSSYIHKIPVFYIFNWVDFNKIQLLQKLSYRQIWIWVLINKHKRNALVPVNESI